MFPPQPQRILSMADFKKWLMKYDADLDGRISMEELQEAIRASGAWFCAAKAKRMMKSADKHSDGFIDENGISMLVAFALKQIGLKVFPK
ncbi:hypothetical protein SASPL_106432 [Salvia splendens]|uniref:EF-hand domain-containing protein n=1 Tax=Salvia splendens TaxID=180675 RepID=A0A8X9ACI7_SALSN|nr:hypothetical protein SASPL_106432 [Salvia splendens]